MRYRSRRRSRRSFRGRGMRRRSMRRRGFRSRRRGSAGRLRIGYRM